MTAMAAMFPEGPIESFNVYPKSLKRVFRGLTNFDYARNRILLATRNIDKISVPSPENRMLTRRVGKKHGPYRK